MVTVGIRNLRVQSKTSQVLDVLTEMILQGRWERDQPIPTESVLCEQLGVSRSILREAIKILATKGLVEVRQGCGTFVRAADSERATEALSLYLRTNQAPLEQLMEVRSPLEVEIARYAALRRWPKHLSRMSEAIEAMKRQAGNLAVSIEADQAFHEALVQATGNPVFEIVTRSMTELLRGSRRVTIQGYGVAKILREHTAIFRAVESGDIDRAADAMRRHMRSTMRDIRDVSNVREG